MHHIADSHTNAYVRTRLALTEDWPTIKTYEEKHWAELADAKRCRSKYRSSLLDSLHRRWVALLESLSEVQWQRGYTHSENGRTPLSPRRLLSMTGTRAIMSRISSHYERVEAGSNSLADSRPPRIIVAMSPRHC